MWSPIDATPVGENVRSTVATYTDILDHLRHLFAAYLLLRTNNIPAAIFLTMSKPAPAQPVAAPGLSIWTSSIYRICNKPAPLRHGRRYTPEVLKIKWHERSIADLLDLDVDTALTVFKDEPTIVHTLQTLHDIGLALCVLAKARRRYPVVKRNGSNLLPTSRLAKRHAFCLR